MHLCRHCYTSYRHMGFSRFRAASLAWRAAQPGPTMDTHTAVWPIVIAGALLCSGVGGLLFILGLLKVWRRERHG